MRKLILSMIGVIRAVVIGLMAGEALCWRVIILAVDMALRTSRVHMCSSQREHGLIVVKRCRSPAVDHVAECTIVVESSGHVIRILHAFIISLMTRITRGGCPGILPADVTGQAVDRHMRPLEGEIRQVVIK